MGYFKSFGVVCAPLSFLGPRASNPTPGPSTSLVFALMSGAITSYLYVNRTSMNTSSGSAALFLITICHANSSHDACTVSQSSWGLFFN